MDIFCKFKEKFPGQIIEETKNFLLVHDGYPLIEGHLLIIPKKHFRCFLEVDTKLIKELVKLKKKTISFLTKYYYKPILFEHGITGQTILHAHLHLLPTEKSILSETKEKGKAMKIFEIPYLYYKENKEYYFQPKAKIPPGFLHTTFAKKLKRPIKGLERAKNLDKWLLSVKSKWTKWSRNKDIV